MAPTALFLPVLSFCFLSLFLVDVVYDQQVWGKNLSVQLKLVFIIS
mgnify:CR=1 FL=1